MLVMLNELQKYGEPWDGGGGPTWGLAQERVWGECWEANLKVGGSKSIKTTTFCAETGDALELPLGRVQKEAEQSRADLGRGDRPQKRRQ